MRSTGTARRYPCHQCPLRSFDGFRQLEGEDLAYVSSFKVGELAVEAGTQFLKEGANSAHVYTALTGWGFRYKMLEDGRRQILNYVFPGDFIGLQASLLSEMKHSVASLTDMLLCMFPRDRLYDLFRSHPNLGFDVTWLAAREEQFLDEHLLALGRRSAEERTAYLLLFLMTRAEARGLGSNGVVALPLTQQHVADTLGLSIVHTNKTLRKLANRGLIAWKGRRLEIVERARLAAIAEWYEPEADGRPYI